MAQQTEIVGADRMAATFGRAARDVGDLTEPEQDTAEKLRGLAARRAPKRSGRLAASGRAVRGVVSFGNGNVDYAVPANFGTGPRPGQRGPHNVPATNYFTGAMAQAARMAPEIFTPPVQNVLDNVKGA
jgi:hypothetical protein